MAESFNTGVQTGSPSASIQHHQAGSPSASIQQSSPRSPSHWGKVRAAASGPSKGDLSPRKERKKSVAPGQKLGGSSTRISSNALKGSRREPKKQKPGRGLKVLRRAFRRAASKVGEWLRWARDEDAHDAEPLLRWGRRSSAEPMLISCSTLLIPAVRLWWLGWQTTAVLLVTSTIAAWMYHLDGERRDYLCMRRMCPIAAALPALLHTWALRSESTIMQLIAFAGGIATVWCFRACRGPPGSYPYEKYHLLMHWMMAGACCAVALGLGEQPPHLRVPV
eukprot:Hpha_TRINITY_DN26207_c0_g1::TRINITY_DN26207_c0_g1_i1::g.184753::m.184753